MVGKSVGSVQMNNYDINQEINRMVGMTGKEEFLEAIRETIADHPSAHIIGIIYDEEEGHFEVCGTEIPIPYAIGMIQGAMDSMMEAWFPAHPEEEEEED